MQELVCDLQSGVGKSLNIKQENLRINVLHVALRDGAL